MLNGQKKRALPGAALGPDVRAEWPEMSEAAGERLCQTLIIAALVAMLLPTVGNKG